MEISCLIVLDPRIVHTTKFPATKHLLEIRKEREENNYFLHVVIDHENRYLHHI